MTCTVFVHGQRPDPHDTSLEVYWYATISMAAKRHVAPGRFASSGLQPQVNFHLPCVPTEQARQPPPSTTATIFRAIVQNTMLRRRVIVNVFGYLYHSNPDGTQNSPFLSNHRLGNVSFPYAEPSVMCLAGLSPGQPRRSYT